MSQVIENPENRTCCPKCGAEDWETDCKQRDFTSMTEKVCCLNCGHIWYEGYTLKLEYIEDEDD